jgi:hypothetical protein
VEAIVPGLKDEVMKIRSVQKQLRAGQRTCFKAFVVVGDGDGHVRLGVKAGRVLRGVEPCGCPRPWNPRGPSPNMRILGVQVFYVYVLQSH